MREIADETTVVVLEARARQQGLNPAKPEVRRLMASAINGDAAGVALKIALGDTEGTKAHEDWRAFSGAYERYTRTLGISPHPKCGKLELMPERLTTSAEDAPPDLRTEDERHRAATNAWGGWAARLARLRLEQVSDIWSAYYGWTDLQRMGMLTPSGRRFVEAWQKLRDAE